MIPRKELALKGKFYYIFLFLSRDINHKALITILTVKFYVLAPPTPSTGQSRGPPPPSPHSHEAPPPPPARIGNPTSYIWSNVTQ